MPQGRRKTPFSGKAKKEQLQMKRDRKGQHTEDLEADTPPVATNEDQPTAAVVKGGADLTDILVNVKLGGRQGGKYDLMFKQETKAEIQASREKSRQPYKTSDDLEEDRCFFPPELDYPLRPKWDQCMSKAALEANEAKYFKQYIKEMLAKDNQSYFELNLETWRQLWRVTEMSDIVLLVVDARYPTAMFPPALLANVKHLVLVLNKIDLIPIEQALAWRHHLTAKHPGLKVAFFTSCPAYNLHPSKSKKLRGHITMAKESAVQIFDMVQDIVQGRVDLSAWKEKIINCSEDQHKPVSVASDQEILTIGTVGQPNAGKSSLINALMGQRVVSVSKTPGHTKHFQTIHITKNVRLCDCPGLVFPSRVPRPLQVLMGSYPISQTREPFAIVQYMAERCDLPKAMRLTHLNSGDSTWSAFDICESWAQKRGYVTARSNRLDVARAANQILRMALDGKIPLAIRPPLYSETSDQFLTHPDFKTVQELLGNPKLDDDHLDKEDDSSSSSDSEPAAAAPSMNKFSVLNT